MSYVQPNTGDSLNDYFHNLANFENMKKNMLQASSLDGFLRWFDKLRTIDARATLITLKHQEQSLPKEWMAYAKAAYKDLWDARDTYIDEDDNL